MVEIDFYELDTDDLIEELESRGYTCTHSSEADSYDDEALLKIYETKKLGGNIDALLNQYFYDKLGRLL